MEKSWEKWICEIASGSLASSFVYGDPLSALASIAALGYSYSKSKNKFNFRRFKWAAIRGGVGVAAFALSTKLISVTLLNFLVGILAAAAARKIIGALRWFEYMKFLKSLRKVIPVLKKEMSRREFLSLQMFTLKRAWINICHWSCRFINRIIYNEPMNTAVVIIGLSILIFLVIFYLKRAKEKRKVWEEEREKIKAYGEKINEETRNRDK